MTVVLLKSSYHQQLMGIRDEHQVRTAENYRSPIDSRVKAFEFEVADILRPGTESLHQCAVWQAIYEHLSCFSTATCLLRIPLRYLENPTELVQFLRRSQGLAPAGSNYAISLMLNVEALRSAGLMRNVQTILKPYGMGLAADAVHASIAEVNRLENLSLTWLKIDAASFRTWAMTKTAHDAPDWQAQVSVWQARQVQIALAAEPIERYSVAFSCLPIDAVCVPHYLQQFYYR